MNEMLHFKDFVYQIDVVRFGFLLEIYTAIFSMYGSLNNWVNCYEHINIVKFTFLPQNKNHNILHSKPYIHSRAHSFAFEDIERFEQ